MPFAFESNRRGFMKILAASPLLAQIAAQQFYEKSASAIGLDPRGNEIGRASGRERGVDLGGRRIIKKKKKSLPARTEQMARLSARRASSRQWNSPPSVSGALLTYRASM